MVIAFHANSLAFPGGFAGVDVFFVISGYLISSNIFDDTIAGRFRLRDFYGRRVRRIAPALTLVLLVCTAAALVIFPPRELLRYARDLVSTILFVPNLDYWRTRGYFVPAYDPLPLQHTWSLGVEEQFYLLFPVFFAWIIARFSRKSWTVIAALGVASLALALVAPEMGHAAAAFYLLPTRAWEFLGGALLVVVPRRTQETPASRALFVALATAGLAGIVLSTFYLDSNMRWPAATMLIPVLSSVAILASHSGAPSPVQKILSWQPVAAIGLISYSLYLWHWPAFVFARFLWLKLSAAQTLATVALTFALAVLSWRFVEQPFRRRTAGFSMRTTLVCWIGSSAVLFAVAAVSWISGGLPARYSATALAYLRDDNPVDLSLPVCARSPQIQFADGRICQFGDDTRPDNSIVVWGDSHAEMLSPVLDSIAATRRVHGYIAMHGGCGALTGYERPGDPTCRTFNDSVMNFIRDKGIRNVVLVGWWSRYSLDRSLFGAQVRKTIATLSERGTRVFIVNDIPYNAGNVPRLLGFAAIRGRDVSEVGMLRAEYLTLNAVASETFRQAADGDSVRVINTADVFCPGERCLVAENGRSLYLDEQHLSLIGVSKLAKLLGSMFDGLK